ncbi:MAG: hypothetical protein E6713_13325 [Sporomusaceae bacterium]|nr:hypothetical protein [Sporomusaceae bacterium]
MNDTTDKSENTPQTTQSLTKTNQEKLVSAYTNTLNNATGPHHNKEQQQSSQLTTLSQASKSNENIYLSRSELITAAESQMAPVVPEASLSKEQIRNYGPPPS